MEIMSWFVLQIKVPLFVFIVNIFSIYPTLVV